MSTTAVNPTCVASLSRSTSLGRLVRPQPQPTRPMRKSSTKLAQASSTSHCLQLCAARGHARQDAQEHRDRGHDDNNNPTNDVKLRPLALSRRRCRVQKWGSHERSPTGSPILRSGSSVGGWVGSSPYSGTRPPGTQNYLQPAALLQTERRHRHVNGYPQVNARARSG